MTANTTFTPISEERKAELVAKGYFIENMGEEHGDEWEGRFRWMRQNSDEFQDGGVSTSEERAWAAADAWEIEKATA